ncbi:MAG: hypothetical protein ACK4IY_07885 [Chitinophagales bacterium]
MMNDLPDLQNLADGDLQYTVDFRNVYATILESWLQTDAKKVLGSNYTNLGFL